MPHTPEDSHRLTPVDPSQMPGRHAHGHAPRTYGAALRAEQLGQQPDTAPRAHDAAQSAGNVDHTVYAPPLNADAQHSPGGDNPHGELANGPDPAPRPKNRRGVKIALGVTAGIVIAVYAAGVVAFSNRFYPNSSIAGVDVSLMSADEAAERIASTIDGYSLHVTGAGLDWTYTPAPGTFSVDTGTEARAALENNRPLMWPIELAVHLMGAVDGAAASTEGTGAAVTFDESALENELGGVIDQLNEGRTGTFDAAGAFDEATGTFTVAKARSNQRIDRDAVIAAAKDAVSSALTDLTLDDSVYEQFANGATDDQLQTACDAANEIIGTSLTLKLGDKEVAVLDGGTMAPWISFDENLNPVLDSTALADWIRNLASTQLDTVGSERTYTRPDGKQVKVSGGTYGWVSDEAALAQLIQDAISNRQAGEIQIPTKQTAAQYNGMGGRDWGALVDIDLTEQHVRYYDANDQLVWESGCISGNPNLGNDTPTGVYYVNNKMQNAELRGAIDPATGQPEYISHVDYWMSFIGGAVGLHDASWQAASSFSDPTAYTRTGSHGCVNLPPDKAAELYNIIQINDCVIVHF